MRANLLVLLVSCLLCLVLSEGAARLLLPAPQRVVVQQTADLAQRMKQEWGTRYELALPSHPEQGRGYLYIATQTGRRLRANTQVVIENHLLSKRTITIRTNALGYRNPELAAKTSRLRILFLGDSITFGDYVQEEETFVRLVEETAAAAGRNWETVNAGVGGISLKNELSILFETGLLTRPDAVVVGFYLNDFQESPGVYIRRLPPLLEKSRLLYHAARLANLYQPEAGVPQQTRERIDVEEWRKAFAAELEARESGSAEKSQLLREALDSFQDWGGAWSPRMWEHVRPLFEELKRLSAERGFALLVAMFPVRQQVEAEEVHDYPQRRMAGLAAELDLPWLDLLPALRAAQRRSREPIFYDHCHHTPHGNRLIAAAVHEFLAVHLNRMLPDGRQKKSVDRIQ